MKKNTFIKITSLLATATISLTLAACGGGGGGGGGESSGSDYSSDYSDGSSSGSSTTGAARSSLSKGTVITFTQTSSTSVSTTTTTERAQVTAIHGTYDGIQRGSVSVKTTLNSSLVGSSSSTANQGFSYKKTGTNTAQVAIGTTNMDYQNFSSISTTYDLTFTSASSGTYKSRYVSNSSYHTGSGTFTIQ